jgi:thiol:disulfide interchange protein DsbD
VKTVWLSIAVGVLGVSVIAEEPQSTAQFFVAYETIKPGERLPVAVRLTVDDGWHTYAKEPGDSGMPPSISIRGVEGLDVSEWRFPPAETFTDSVGTTYGYEHEVVLLSDVLIPERVAEGRPIELTASIQWMICREMCVFKKTAQTVSVQSGVESSGPSAQWISLLKESGRERSAPVTGNVVPGKEP